MSYQDIQNITLRSYNPPSSSTNLLANLIKNMGSKSLFQETEDLHMSITKFSVPISTCPLLNITDTTTYKVSMLSGVPAIGSNYALQIYQASSSLPLTSVYPITSINDFVEQINLSLLNCYTNLLTTLENSSGSNIKTVTHASQVYTNTNTSTTFSYGSFFASGGFASNVILTLSNVISSGQRVTIELKNDSSVGTVCRIATGIILEPGVTYTFASTNPGRPQNFAPILDGTLIHTSQGRCDYQPQSSFVAFSPNNPDGNWILNIYPAGDTSNQTLNLTMDTSLKIWGSPLAISSGTQPAHMIYCYPPSACFITQDPTTQNSLGIWTKDFWHQVYKFLFLQV